MANGAKGVYACIGASNHSLEEREEHDFYSTDPKMAYAIMELEPQLNNIWEPCCGTGHLAKPFEEKGKLSYVSDLVDRGYRPEKARWKYGEECDMLKIDTTKKYNGDIVTNPPYAICQEVITNALEKLEGGRYCCMFLKLTFLESKSRQVLFDKYPPKRVWVSRSRVQCPKDGNIEKYHRSAIAYAWYVWQKGYQGDTILKWFN